MTGRIFISYRRDDVMAAAGRLHDRLAIAFGRNSLFMDVDRIPAGADFVTYLDKQVAGCDVFLVVIGSRWLSVTDSDGRRRLDNPDDFLVIEIASALDRDKLVIPVLMDGAPMPAASDLPEKLKPLVRRQAVKINNEEFGRDCEVLIAKIREAVDDDNTQDWAKMAAGVAVLVVVAGGAFYLKPSAPSQPVAVTQDESRKKAEDQPGRDAQEAMERAADAEDDAAFAKAKGRRSRAALIAYMKRYQRHRDEAKELLRALDFAAFKDAQRTGTISALQDYLDEWPDGQNVDAATVRIGVLKAKQADSPPYPAPAVTPSSGESAPACESVAQYSARLSSADHFNSRGERLRSAAAIIRQDRANFHQFGIRDPEDEGDGYFSSMRNRVYLERTLEGGRLPSDVAAAIVRGTPLVSVTVCSGSRDNHIVVSAK